MFKKIIVVVLVLFVGGYVYSNYKMKVTKPGFLDQHLTEIEEKIEFRDNYDPEVSQVAVAWHLDHMLKTVNEICKALEASNPKAFKSSISIPRTMSLTMNFIPRGRAQSPSVVRPPDTITTANIRSQLLEAKKRISTVFELDENVHFEHPVFGVINRGQSLRFIEVHTNHHLKIVRDILKD